MTVQIPLIKKPYFPYLLLAVISIPLFFLNIIDVHSWGDDFAQYIKEALNIAHGRPFYESGYVYNHYNTEYAPPQYPPGYPLLLAPVVKIWGISYRAMAYFNTCITVALLFALFAYFKKRTGKVAAVCLAVAITYSGYILGLKKEVLADTSCLALVALYLALRNSAAISFKKISLLSLILVAASLMRTQAKILLAAECLFLFYTTAQLIIREKKFDFRKLAGQPSILIIIVSAVLLFVADKIIFPVPINTSDFYNQFIHKALSRPLSDTLKEDIGMLFQQMAWLFHHNTFSEYSKATMEIIQGAVPGFVVTGFILSVKEKLSVDDVFFMLMCLMVLYLPVHDVRYLVPAMPLLFYYCYRTIRVLASAITSRHVHIIAILLTLLYFKTGYIQLKKAATEVPDGCVPHKDDFTAFSYIKQHVKENEIIAFTKPRFLTLYTGKKCINTAWELPPARNKEILDSFGVKYVLVVDGLESGYYNTLLRENLHPVDSARISQRYTLFTLR